METKDEDIGELLDRLTSGDPLQKLTLNRTKAADGTVTEHWQIDSPEDVTLYQQIMELSAPPPAERAGRVDSPGGATHADGPAGDPARRGDHHLGQGP